MPKDTWKKAGEPVRLSSAMPKNAAEPLRRQSMRAEAEEGHMRMLKSIPKVALILVFMPFLLFGVVVWTPIRKLFN